MDFRRIVPAVLAAILIVPAAGCGGGAKPADIPDQASAGPSKEELAKQAAAEKAKANAPDHKTVLPISTDTSKKPAIPKPSGVAPKQLTIKDIVPGTGPAAKNGDNLTVKYVGVSWSNGEQFDASWDKKTSFPVTLGAGGVIKGWDQGLVGMKAGGRRELVIPPDLGYGSAGSPPKIAADETLVFVIDLEKIGKKK